MITASNEVKTAQNKTNREVEDGNTKKSFPRNQNQQA